MDFDRDRDRERPHFSTTTNNTTTTTEQQVFICFSSSRLSSSSSMKLTKSILSPARAARDPSHQLSSSLSRRNGSLKGGASPFFTTKKRGCGGGGAFENPEPSSPKVTCIGQVRVKTKKKVRQQTRNLSRRRSGKEGSSSSSFRKSDSDLASAHSRSGYHNQKQECFPHRTSSSSNNQKWAYFPSICEGFSCLFPCSSSSKSSCFSTRSKCIGGGEKRGENGCGAVFTRWLVSVNDGEKRREIELVVGGGDDDEEDEEEERRRMSMRSSRRHVFDDIQIKDDRVIEVNNDEDDEGKEEGGRVSICIPPKNALLLMRCRSDPMKVAALASRFSWDANAGHQDKDGGEHEGEDEEEGRYSVDGFGGLFGKVKAAKDKDEIFMDTLGPLGNEEVSEAEGRRTSIEMGLGDNNDNVHEDDEKDEPVEIVGDEMVVEYVDEMEKDTVVEEGDELEEEVESNMDSFEALLDQENAAGATVADEDDEVSCPRLVHVDDDEELAESSPVYLSSSSTESDSEQEEDSECSELAALYSEKPEKDAFFDHQQIQKFEKDAIFDHQQIDKFDKDAIFDHQQIDKFEKDAIFDHQQQQELQVPPNQEKPVLPDCLLLMMCEPKLSMEVSKETWVCSTDFIRWLPDRPPKKSAAKPGCTHDPPVKKPDPSKQHKHLLPEKVENPPPALQPRRSSCSLPPKGPSMAVQIEQKLVNSAAYEPLVLTRCKSEPMRTAAAKLMPDSFYWKNAIRKLEEPHRRATVGAAAGVGC